MEILRWKTRIAVLWVFMAVGMSTHSIMGFLEPGMIEQVMSGEMEGMALTPGMLVFMALFSLVPLWLAFVSMTVKDSLNRWVNFVLGMLFTTINIIHFFECGVPLGAGPIAEPTSHHILLVGSTIVVTALIAWYAWNWPKQEA